MHETTQGVQVDVPVDRTATPTIIVLLPSLLMLVLLSGVGGASW